MPNEKENITASSYYSSNLSQVQFRGIKKQGNGIRLDMGDILVDDQTAEVPLLVYEFVSNRNLSHHIHDAIDVPLMSLRVAEEIADALSYLHSAASMLISLRDIKSDNILLDSNFNAKVFDSELRDRSLLTKLI
ncbi:Serine/threonine protein kinase [Cinnamomum micranthum f. kanehirae]|uniref:Serine/threonine protein kinase n=1 Tax=Cinnamomum micranthum f. kanehirae TaxID=337451 RepID=A0A443PLW3_9MAGN|nr:Serine/threonine protein kinase [Cinnamomum micranthum f. kanehirae]